MKTLILNVDRDDDFGRKAKVKSPIVGLEKNIEAANKLGQADAEDSDLNAIFYAISTYKKLKEQKRDVEIATICGDISVGLKSDEILSEQIEEVLIQTKSEDVILISDGAEDEYILPLIQSRIKIRSINRVCVKQSKELEDSYYRILKLLDDEKVQKQFILPIALVLIVWALFVLLNIVGYGLGAILLTLGAYLLIRVFRWEKNIAIMCNEIKSGLFTGKLSIYTYIVAIIVLLAFGIYAYTNTNFSAEFQPLSIVEFIFYLSWGIAIAGLLSVFGRAVDVYVRDKKVPLTYYMAPFSLLAMGFILYGGLGALKEAFKNMPANFIYEPFQQASFILYTISGILILMVGIIIRHFKKENRELYGKVNESENKIADKN